MPRRLAKLAKKAAAKKNCMFTSTQKTMEMFKELSEEGFNLVEYIDATKLVKECMEDERLFDLMTKKQRFVPAIAILEKKEGNTTTRYCFAGDALYGVDKKEMEEYVKATDKVRGMYDILACMALSSYTLDITGQQVTYEVEKPLAVCFTIEDEE